MRTSCIRRRLLLALVPVSLAAGVSFPARAEPIACLPAQRGCGEEIIEQKVRRSFGRAAHAFVGRLESIQDSRHGGAKTRIFTFTIEKQYKGTLAGEVARVSIDSWLAGGKDNATGAARSLGEFERLESKAEWGYTEADQNRYQERVEALRAEIEKNGAAEPAATHVVRLNLYYGDLAVRMTDIPMRIGERYAVFVLTKLALAGDPAADTGGMHTWIPDPVDLYSMNGKRGRRALAALDRASGSKR